jgi:hypothetical protein
VNEPLVIEARPPGFRERLSRRLRGGRLLFAGLLAAGEVIAVLVWGGSALLLAVLALAVLVAAVAIAVRLAPGPLRDTLWIVAIAQGIVVVIPLLVGLSVVVAILVAALVIVGLVAYAFNRLRS